MYKLILVDDESEIRQGLMEVIPFEALGFEVVGEAANGVEALQLCEALHPDLMMTDIRMPLMDGLTLCKRVRELYPLTQFIILSGYDDYEYVKKAIEVKTMGYLLKPLTAEEFKETLRDARDALDSEFRQRNDIEKLKEHFAMSFPLLKEALFSALLSGSISSARALESAARYDLNLTACGYVVALIRVAEGSGEAAWPEPELLDFSVINILEEVLAPSAGVHICHYNGMLAAILLLAQEGEGTYDSLIACIKAARETVAYYLKCLVHIGVSAECKGLSGLNASRQAMSALDQSMLEQDETVLCIGDLMRERRDDIVMDEYRLRKLSSFIKVGDAEKSGGALAEIMDICRQGHMSAKAYQSYLMEIFIAFVRVVSDMDMDRTGFSAMFETATKRIMLECPAIDDAQAMLSDIAYALSNAASLNRKNAGMLLSSQAEEFLKAYFCKEDVSVEMLCRHLHISPSYFSLVFKKETKKTFHQYLTELRMDKALTLLSTTDLKTAGVAKQVGIPDPSYFSYCFKKHFGFSPSAARKQREES